MNTESNAVPDSPLGSPAIAPAAMSVPRPFYWSVRRELWENRSIYVAPLAVAAVVLLGSAISLVGVPRSVRGVAALHLAAASTMPPHPHPHHPMLLVATLSR